MFSRTVLSVITMLEADYIEEGDLSYQLVGVSTDSRTIDAKNLYIPLVGESFDGHDYIEMVKRKGVSTCLWQLDHKPYPKDMNVILVEDTLLALGKLAKEYRNSIDVKIVGITGSNGKTSAKDMLASVLSLAGKTTATKGNYNNEIGVPYTLFDMDEDTKYAVVEMGMENFDEIHYLTQIVQPDIAYITSIGTAHLVNLGSIENIAKAKLEILDGLKEGGCFVHSSMQDVLVNAIAEKDIARSTKFKTFGHLKYDDITIGDYVVSTSGTKFKINDDSECYEIPLVGMHQVYNAAGVILCARALGIDDVTIRNGLRHCTTTGLRSDILKYGEATIINDSYKSNPQSLEAALETVKTFKSPYKIAILGDMLDLGDDSAMIHFNIGKELSTYGVNEVITVGEMSRYINQAVWGSDIVHHHMMNNDEIVELTKDLKYKDCLILVKGSRALHMDEIVDAWMEV